MNSLGKWSGVMAAMLVAAAFFEGAGFSFQILDMRVRSVQVLEIVFLGFLGVLWLSGKWRWQKSPLDFWLLAYLSINFIAIFNSPWQARAVKIFLLLVTLALLYWLVYQLLRTVKDFFLAFYVFLAMGTLQVLFGLYQVLAGALNHYRGWSLPIGYMGMVHREYINSVWGRPYGTQVEPDFYGAICMVFALIFFSLYFSGRGKTRKWLLAGAVISLIGLYLSFVRTAWLIFLLLFLLQFVFKKKWPFLKANWKLSAVVIGAFFGFHLLAVQLIAPIKAINEFRFTAKVAPSQKKAVLPLKAIHEFRFYAKVMPSQKKHNFSFIAKFMPFQQTREFRFYTKVTLSQKKAVPEQSSLFNSQNIRFVLIKISWQAFLQNPVLGSGPGSFAYFYWEYCLGEVAAQKKITEKAFPQTDPSMPFTILEDTGIIGFVLFAAIIGLFGFLNFKGIAKSGVPPAPLALALFISLLALLMSYIMTSGFWLPLTWVFLGLNIASLKRFPEVSDG
jgi:hypothetical protein